MVNHPENDSRAGTEIAGHHKPDVPHVGTIERTRRERLSSHEGMTPPHVGTISAPSNTWPEGVRRVLCLNCDRTFESESKAQRLRSDCR